MEADGETKGEAKNRLARESSPYLRQHEDDPVDWFPWGDEAFARALELDRPVFLSIGYSACHWCHVMGHESFADEATARLMNETVVAVKVDREERPDVDSIYMEAVQAATGHGGWPMSVFATPDGRPFFAGTYFPDRPRFQTPAFTEVLGAVGDAWATRRDEVEKQADALSAAVAQRVAPPPPLALATEGSEGADGGGSIDAAAVTAAIASASARLTGIADMARGGFGRAPKFPQPLLIDLLLRAADRGLGATGAGRGHGGGGTEVEGHGAGRPGPLEVALLTLEAMASGGIYDHVGGGISRYSVDQDWLVPHFEKMLYDQALIARAYLHAWQITGDERWRQVVDELISYVLRTLSLPSGLLASAEDADSEGEEGRFYTWTLADFIDAVGPDLATEAIAWYGVNEEGNFEGRNILHRTRRGELTRPARIEQARARLELARAGRPRPGRDDKALTEWNAMMCSLLAEVAGATDDDAVRDRALQLGRTLLRDMRDDDGRVLRVRREAGPIRGYAGDVAWLLDCTIRLFELSGDPALLGDASSLAEELLEHYLDPSTGGLFTTADDAETLLVRPRELFDNVIPAASSVAAVALARLAALSGRAEFADAAERLVRAAWSAVIEAPTAVPELLLAAELVTSGPVEVVAGEGAEALLARARRRYLPTAVFVRTDDRDPSEARSRGAGSSPLLEDREAGAVYVCSRGACRLPATSWEEVATELDAVIASSRSSSS